MRLFCFSLLVAGTATAQSEAFGVGDGHDGALVVSLPSQVINRYASIIGAADGGLLLDAPANFVVGDLVVALKSTCVGTSPKGVSTIRASDTCEVGRWAMARVTALSTSGVSLTSPITGFDVAGQTAQLIRVAEFTT